jgi:hypothetical protein
MDQKEVKAKIGEVLHLPIIPVESWDNIADEVWIVRVNGTRLEHPTYFNSYRQTSVVFKAEKAGEYKVEVDARAAPPIPGEGPLWGWRIIVSE